MQKMREKTNDSDLSYPSIKLEDFNCSSKRREIAIFCCELFSNMNWKDRIWFVITGNYWGPLQRTSKKLNIEAKKVQQMKISKAQRMKISNKEENMSEEEKKLLEDFKNAPDKGGFVNELSNIQIIALTACMDDAGKKILDEALKNL